MKLYEILTESLGKLRDVVGPKFTRAVNWKALFGRPYSSAFRAVGPDGEIREFTTKPTELDKMFDPEFNSAVAFVIFVGLKQRFFATKPHSRGGKFALFYDFSGLLDDDETKLVIGGIVDKELGHRLGKIIFSEWSEFEALLNRLLHYVDVDAVTVKMIMPDDKKLKKQTERVASNSVI